MWLLPVILKYAVIKQLPKNGDRCGVSNYRTVSLITLFWKLYDMVMQRRILNKSTKYNMLSTEHYGFRIGLKADNAIYEINNWDFKSYEQWEGIFELEKAFDCVHHDIILSKLIFCWINGQNLAHYKFYLHNRPIRTTIHYDSDESGTMSH